MAERTCSIDGCERGGKLTRGWCRKHYARWRSNGDPNVTRIALRSEAAAILDRVVAMPVDAHDSPCELWTIALDTGGYGRVMIDGKRGNVCHVILERTGRPRPPSPGDCALHSCDTPSCVNPAHLRWGSQAENSLDRSSRGRASSTGNPITAADIHAIRKAWRGNGGSATLTELAKTYGVNATTIQRIATGQTWKALP